MVHLAGKFAHENRGKEGGSLSGSIPLLDSICEQVAQLINIMAVEIEDDSEDIQSLGSAASSDFDALDRATTVGSGSSTSSLMMGQGGQ